MKVLISFPGVHRRGGVERVAFECTRFLAERGHDVHVLASEWEPLAHKNIFYHRVKTKAFPAFLNGQRYFAGATTLARSLGCDVLSTHGCVCPMGGVQWVQSVHAAWLDRAREMRKPLSLNRFKQRFNPVHPVLLRLEEQHFSDRAYQKIITTTPEVADDLKKYYGVPASDTIVIPNGFNPAEFSEHKRAALRAAARQKVGLGPSEIGLLFVANELQRKGYATLLAAVQELRDRRIKILVVGRPSVRQVARQANMAGLGDQVIALGPCSDVASMHAAADLFVLPTQYEAFALAILEALGSGLPVVTTSVPGARNAIIPGLNGYICQDPLSSEELANLLRPLLDHETINALSLTTPATVEHYKWPNILRRYEEVLATYAS